MSKVDLPSVTAAAQAALQLPVHDVADELLDAIRRHQVVVVEGPTGSGKTTQLPRILLHAGLTDRIIGVTQPRRIAATSVAARIAEEEGVSVGGLVGHSIRFDDQTSDATRIKIMTDGILLEEARHDHDFDAYGIIMVDEAHERTLNIDVTLGLLARALRRRADLRVVISSATLDPELFVRFFDDVAGPVPTVHIDARPHPVKVEYKVVPDTGRESLTWAVCDEIDRICRSGQPGHVLAFLTGEGPIQSVVAELMRRRVHRMAEVLPLYGAMERDEQNRIFGDFGRRKIVLATNIAETSITVADVRFVIDTGIAKVPRFDPRTGIRTLAEEKVARANCDQRAGRAGRTAPGVAIRLYSRKDYESRPLFGDEEIRRLDLREVALRLIDLGIRDLEDFELPTPPSRGRLRESLQWLQRLHIIDSHRHLTSIGRRIVPFPLTPALGLMVVYAADNHPEVMDEVLVLAAFLSSRRPWSFPIGEEGEARVAQGQFADPRGDVVTLLHLWQAYLGARDADAFCKRVYVDRHVMGFVARAHVQLREIARKHEMPVEGGGKVDGVVNSFAAGFADNILYASGKTFIGPGDARVTVHPGSSCAGTNARFLVAAEIIILARIYASTVAVIDARTVAQLAPELAAHLRLRTARPAEGKAEKKNAFPDFVRISDATLPIVDRRGRVQVDIPWAALPALRAARREDLEGFDSRIGDLKARILSGDHVWAAGTPLRALLRLLPALPIPDPDADLTCRVPEGVIFEADRNLHGLLRHLPALMEPMKPAHRGKPGWLGLVHNGAEGFWLEVMLDFGDALEATSAGLTALAAAIDDSDPSWMDVEAQGRRIGVIAERFDAVRKGKGRGRGR